MNCSDWEEKFALYAGGDLSAAEAAGVEGHVAECAGCQMLLSGLRESLRLVREAHQDPVDGAHYSAVRVRVLSELERTRAPWWRHAWIFAAVAAAMLLVVAVRPKEVSVPAPVAKVQPAPAVQTTAAPATSAQATPVPRPPRRKQAPKEIAVKAEPPAEPLVVKLVTDDPNVIIYWITDTKGE